jgi:PAS domain S-box-containing protein
LREPWPDDGHNQQASAQLQPNERSYRELVEGIGDILYAADAHGVLTYASPAVQAILGYSPGEMVGRHVREFIHPDDRHRQAENLSRLLSGGNTSNEYRLLTCLGEVRWMRTSSQPVVSAGRIVGVRGMLADVTDRKLAELQLERQNQFLTSVLESLSHPFYVVNVADYTVEIANSAARQAGIGTWSFCFALTHGRETPCEGTEHPCPIESVRRTGKPVTVEHVHHRPDGPDRHFEVHAYPLFDGEGKVAKIIEYTLDITERKQADAALRDSEAKLRALFEVLPVGISILDRDRQVVSENPALGRILRLGPGELRQGRHRSRTYLRSDGTAMPPDEFPSTRALEEHRPVQEQVGVVTEDGEAIWVEVSAAPVEMTDWKVVLATVDITARKQAEKALRAAAVAAERSRLARDLHDSVTQALFSASLVAEVLPQVWQRDRGEAMEALEELRELTRGALAEMRALLLELHPSSLLESRLDVLIRQLVEAVMRRCDARASLTLQPAPSLRPDVQVTFYRVCQEALQNAIKHGGARQIGVSLRVSPDASAGQAGEWHGQLLLEVSDDGRGFDTRPGGPEQMGLRIMQERADGIGAHLTVDSRPGRGTGVLLAWRSAQDVQG